MKFEDAMVAMRAGKTVTRPDYEDYQKLRIAVEPRLVDRDGDKVELDSKDILAEDWEEVNDV